MLNGLRILLPDQNQSTAALLQKIRAELTDRALFFFASLFSVVYVISLILLFFSIEVFQTTLQSNIGRTVILIGLWRLATTKTLTRELKVVGLVIILYFIGIAAFLIFGVDGPSRFILLSIPILLLVLSGYRSALISIVLNIALVLLSGWLQENISITTQNQTLIDGLSDGRFIIVPTAIFTIFTGLYFALFSNLKNRLFETITEQLNFTNQLELNKVQINARIEKRVRFIEYSSYITQQLSHSGLDQEALFDNTTTLLGQMAGYPFAQIYQFNELYGRLYLQNSFYRYQSDLNIPRAILLGQGMIGETAKRREPILIPDLSRPPKEISDVDLAAFLSASVSALAVPILSENRLIGVLAVQHNLPNQLDGDDIYLLQVVAEQLAGALRYSQLFNQLKMQLEYEEALDELNDQIQEATSMEEVLALAAEKTHALFQANRTVADLN